MSVSRAKSPLLAALSLAALTLTGCPNGDIGSPCNHGLIDPPKEFLLTFPALSCNELLCVYGEQKARPTNVCSSDSECNGDGGDTFACDQDGPNGGECVISLDYVLERSMCSKRCSSDADCKQNGAFDKPVVEDDKTACNNGFKCVVLQEVGAFCCEKLCVCDDDLPDTSKLAEKCAEPGMNGPKPCE